MRHLDSISAHISVIERVIQSIARRYALSEDEAEDFSSWARLRLVQNDAVFTRYQGRSRLDTYLQSVIHNLFRDYRIAKWGKWRPSAAARRLGAAAVELERLIVRDGCELRYAVEQVLARHNGTGTASRADLEAIAEQFASRRRFRPDTVAELPPNLVTRDTADDRVEGSEMSRMVGRIEAALARGFERLEPLDRMILKLRFGEGLKVVQIAPLVKIDSKQLYSRLERSTTVLRQTLQAAGIRSADVARALGWVDFDLEIDFSSDPE